MAGNDHKRSLGNLQSARSSTAQLLGHSVTTKAAQPTSAQGVGDAVAGVVEPMRKGKNFVPPALLEAWPEIVGVRLAKACTPLRLKALPKSRSRHAKAVEGGLLEVRADPSIAVDLDYGQSLIVERANTFFGYSAVARLKILPGEGIERTPASPDRPALRVSSQNREQAKAATQAVADESLREALKALGSQVFAASGKTKG